MWLQSINSSERPRYIACYFWFSDNPQQWKPCSDSNFKPSAKNVLEHKSLEQHILFRTTSISNYKEYSQNWNPSGNYGEVPVIIKMTLRSLTE
jgi:hypothetical protein